jgi:hypothetical protein
MPTEIGGIPFINFENEENFIDQAIMQALKWTILIHSVNRMKDITTYDLQFTDIWQTPWYSLWSILVGFLHFVW